MLNQSLNNNNTNTFTENTKITKEKMICKDGFCSLPNHKENSKKDPNDMNLFDPIK